MNDLFKKLTLLKSEKLTPDERREMRARIVARMETYPQAQPTPFLFGLSVRSRRAIGFTVASLLAVSTGASYAAASALPGDILYPIKININERIETALAVTPKASAEVAARQIKRRAVEAEILAKEDRLDETKKDQLAEETRAHVDTYNRAREKIERKGDRADVEELEGNIHRTIQEHEHALTDIGVVTVSTSTDAGGGTSTSLRGGGERKGEFLERALRNDKEDTSSPSLQSPSRTDEEKGSDAPRQREVHLPVEIKNENMRNQMGDEKDIKVENSSTSTQVIDMQEKGINVEE